MADGLVKFLEDCTVWEDFFFFSNWIFVPTVFFSSLQMDNVRTQLLITVKRGVMLF